MFISSSKAVAEFTDLHWFCVILLQNCKVTWVGVIDRTPVLHLPIALLESTLEGVVLVWVLFLTPRGGHLAAKSSSWFVAIADIEGGLWTITVFHGFDFVGVDRFAWKFSPLIEAVDLAERFLN